jgi:hypothetical protein
MGGNAEGSAITLAVAASMARRRHADGMDH